MVDGLCCVDCFFHAFNSYQDVIIIKQNRGNVSKELQKMLNL